MNYISTYTYNLAHSKIFFGCLHIIFRLTFGICWSHQDSWHDLHRSYRLDGLGDVSIYLSRLICYMCQGKDPRILEFAGGIRSINVGTPFFISTFLFRLEKLSNSSRFPLEALHVSRHSSRIHCGSAPLPTKCSPVFVLSSGWESWPERSQVWTTHH